MGKFHPQLHDQYFNLDCLNYCLNYENKLLLVKLLISYYYVLTENYPEILTFDIDKYFSAWLLSKLSKLLKAELQESKKLQYQRLKETVINLIIYNHCLYESKAKHIDH